MLTPPLSVAHLAVLAALAVLSGACRSASIPERMELPTIPAAATASELMRLGPNDIVRARVHGYPELSTPESTELTGTRIDPEGNLSLPLIGALPVAGLKLGEARERIRTAYAGFMKDPQIDVSVVEYAARRFYLYGQVAAPGAYAIDRPLNVYQALTFGEGFAKHADRRRIVLLRETEDEVEVHLIDGEMPDETGLIAILPNDFLFVRRTGVGKFSEDVLPILSGISSSLSSIATLILIEDRLED